MSTTAWGAVRENTKALSRPRTSEQSRRPVRRPQSPASARPSTSHVSARRPQTSSRASTSTPMSKFAVAAQKAVSIVNSGCLCKHPTLGRNGGGKCEHCERTLPTLVAQQNFPLRSRSGSVQFGEAPPLPKANKPNMGIVGTPGSHEQNRPRTVDGSSGGRRARFPSQAECEPSTMSPNRLSPEKEDRCP